VTRRPESLCRATKADGSPCQAFAGASGFCSLHANPDQASVIGRSGGRGRTRSVLGISDEVADDKLRGKAKRRLEQMLDSEDEGKRLAPARALYSYGPAKPPVDEALAPVWPSRQACRGSRPRPDAREAGRVRGHPLPDV
jgi:hypothetical protein